MGLLDHLWDDTVAGPLPENGLGKLRKHHTFSFRPSSGNDKSDVRPYGGDSPEEAVKVTRSIMIIKPPGYQGGSAPVSPAGSSTPEERNPFGLGEGRLLTRSIRQQDQRMDQGTLLLLTACDL
ncbi:hypothetical protein HA466_0204530 [Hirschfeldia incana]|nr:hypothetical protein HA466_0204530 [Hirschfeldia incana]